MESTIQSLAMTLPFQTTDWSSIPRVAYPGETGIAWSQSIEYPQFRMRLVEYSSGYKANHWCERGHIVFCLTGEFISELSDGKTFHLTKGMSYQVSNGVSSHRSFTNDGTILLIIDGAFLN